MTADAQRILFTERHSRSVAGDSSSVLASLGTGVSQWSRSDVWTEQLADDDGEVYGTVGQWHVRARLLASVLRQRIGECPDLRYVEYEVYT